MNEEYYINLIYKSLDGVLASSEEQELKDWRQVSDENEKTYISVKVAWQNAEKVVDVPEIDLDAEFDLLQDRIEIEDDEKVISIQRLERKPIRSRWLTIAASIVVLFGTSFFFKDVLFGSKWIEVNSGENIQTLILADNSEVLLNKNTRFWYPKEFTENQRLVRLEGEAFFKVSRNESKPFIIETQDEKVKVLGTSFNLRSHPEESEASLYVATGKVSFEIKQGGEQLILKPGNEGVFSRKTKTLQKLEKGSLNALSWVKKELIFDDTPLKEVVKELKNHFNVSLTLESAGIERCTFTGKFKEESLSDVLGTLTLVLRLEVEKISESEYTLNGEPCE
jgi:ferric-dicitrate binding protein FerR (iron transport regulator)